MELNDIKRRVYAMRNGITADVLRRSGASYRMIFGVNLPHLAEIASEIGCDAEVADKLWADNGVRESLMLATMVYPPELMTREKAMTWLREAPTVEIVDMLCHRVIRKMPEAAEMAHELLATDNDLLRYAALRIYFNLLPAYRSEARAAATIEQQRGVAQTAMIAVALIDELDFFDEK